MAAPWQEINGENVDDDDDDDDCLEDDDDEVVNAAVESDEHVDGAW